MFQTGLLGGSLSVAPKTLRAMQTLKPPRPSGRSATDALLPIHAQATSRLARHACARVVDLAAVPPHSAAVAVAVTVCNFLFTRFLLFGGGVAAFCLR